MPNPTVPFALRNYSDTVNGIQIRVGFRLMVGVMSPTIVPLARTSPIARCHRVPECQGQGAGVLQVEVEMGANAWWILLDLALLSVSFSFREYSCCCFFIVRHFIIAH